MTITYFAIEKLFGTSNLSISLNENKIIIIAENGEGKTTILRLLYLFLSKQWGTLVEWHFSRVIAIIDGKEYSFIRENYADQLIPESIIQTLLQEFPNYSEFLKKTLSKYSVDQLIESDFLQSELEGKYDIPISLIYSIVNEIDQFKSNDKRYPWKANILYLPTYRRIEQGFNSLYGDISKRLASQIKQTFPEIAQKIRREKSASHESYSAAETDLLGVFDALWSSRDFERWSSKYEKNFYLELIEFGMEDVKYHVENLLTNSKGGSAALDRYISTCNRYLTNRKTLELSKNGRSIVVKTQNSTIPLSLNSLSAGEKQIVSVFSYLLTNPEETIVIVDEPELSLSMVWQEMYLEDILNLNVGGLIVATHSPFIVTPKLKELTHSIDEFRI